MAKATKTLGELPVDALIVDDDTTIYGEPIVWRKVGNNIAGMGSDSSTIRTDRIIKIAAFDAREPSNPELDYDSVQPDFSSFDIPNAETSDRRYWEGWPSYETPSDADRQAYDDFHQLVSQREQQARDKLTEILSNTNFSTFGQQNKGYPVYSKSNIRSWLNSAQQNWYGAQHSYDNPPSSAYVSNPYDSDPGFLYNCSQNFRNALLTITASDCQTKTYWVNKEEYYGSETGRFGFSFVIRSGASQFSVNDKVVIPPVSYGNVYPTEEAVSHSSYFSGLDTEQPYTYYVQQTNGGLMNTLAYTMPSASVTVTGGADAPRGIIPTVAMSQSVIVSAEPDENGHYKFLYVENNAPTAPPSITVPATVTTGVQYTVSWEASTDPDGDPVTYELGRKLNGTGSYSVIYTGSVNSFSDTLERGNTAVQYRVRAKDDSDAYSGYTTSPQRNVINNAVPTISGTDTDLGNLTSPPSYTYSVDDEDENDTLNVTIRLDGNTVSTISNAVREQSYTYSMTAADFLELSTGSHTLVIKVTDSAGGSAQRTLTFGRTLTGAEFIVRIPSVEGNAMPAKILVSCPYRNDGTVTETLKVCNNVNDSSPTWENGRIGRKMLFDNTSKTNSDWGIGVWIRIAKGSGCTYITVNEPTIQYNLEEAEPSDPV